MPFLQDHSEAARKVPAFQDDKYYQLLERVGSSSRKSSVFRAKCEPVNLYVAVKIVDVPFAQINVVDAMRFEHDNLLKPFCIFSVQHTTWVVSALVNPGNLLHFSATKFLTESSVMVVLGQVLDGLWYLHQRGRAHRGVSIGNILIDSSTGTTRLVDYGVNSAVYNTSSGSGYWTSPEKDSDSMSNDIWGFGVCALEIVYGGPPISVLPMAEDEVTALLARFGANDYRRFLKFNRKPLEMPKVFWEMISLCLQINPTSRPTSDELRHHSFFKQTNMSGNVNLIPYKKLGHTWDFNPVSMQMDLKEHHQRNEGFECLVTKEGFCTKFTKCFREVLTTSDQLLNVVQKVFVIIGLYLLVKNYYPRGSSATGPSAAPGGATLDLGDFVQLFGVRGRYTEAGIEDSRSATIDVVADIKSERLVVLGGSGFVGSAICKAAVSQGIEVISLSRSGRPSYSNSWVDQVTWKSGDVFYCNWDDVLVGATAVVSTLGGFGSEEQMQRINGEANILAVTAAKDYGVVLRPGFIYGKRKVDGFEIPLDLIGEPVERILRATESFTKPLSSLPASDLLLAPPVSADDVAFAVINAVTDDDFFGIFTIEQIKEAAVRKSI